MLLCFKIKTGHLWIKFITKYQNAIVEDYVEDLEVVPAMIERAILSRAIIVYQRSLNGAYFHLLVMLDMELVEVSDVVGF